MKKVYTSLNEQQFKRYVKHTEKLHTTPYSHAKSLILRDLGGEKAVVVRTTIIYLFTLYSLIASVIVLVF